LDRATQRVEAVRRFNRLYTRRIGVLQDGYLESPFSLAEVRVLYELAHRQQTTASELARQLELDPGYLSRILRKFHERGMLERTRSARDGRETHLSLTPHGRDTFEPLEAGARKQIGALLNGMSEARQDRLVDAMASIEDLLEPPSTATDAEVQSDTAGQVHTTARRSVPADDASGQPIDSAVVLRTVARPGDFGWVVERHGAIYAQEYGWDLTFEALVASIVAKFVEHFDPERERVWIAERNGERLGCLFLVRASRRVAKLRLFLVEPDARGLGIGRHMVDELIAFARASGYHTVRLWTQSVLLAARHIYAQAGFKLIAEEPNHAFGADLVSETWEVRL
jgi:DNA-binding MarR family transcriptional regulator/N-acetylglutamate synthase-like GNAT family acetyltransferase